MKNYRHEHQHGRNARGFESHKRNRGSDSVRQGRAWRFRREELDFFEPHLRPTARMAALPGKHMRCVQEVVRSSHGK